MAIDIATLRLRHYPDAVLRQRAKPVPGVTPEVRAVAAAMIDLMYRHEGIGLAAPQVGLAWRMFVADVPARDGRSPDADPPTATRGPVVYINPKLSAPTGELRPDEEGCLSLPDILGEVLRPETVTITAMDLEGVTFSRTASGLLSRCWQHEADHLDGVLIIDRMTQLSRLRMRASIRDMERSANAR